MIGRFLRRNPKSTPKPYDKGTYQGAAALTGGTSVSLSGESLILNDEEYEVSSFNSSNLGGAMSNIGNYSRRSPNLVGTTLFPEETVPKKGNEDGVAGVPEEGAPFRDEHLSVVSFDDANGGEDPEKKLDKGYGDGDDDDDDDYDEKAAERLPICPLWLRESSPAIKGFIAGCLILLILALLVMIAAAAIGAKENGNNNNGNSAEGGLSPPGSPIMTPTTTTWITSKPAPSVPTREPTDAITMPVATPVPTLAPVQSPTIPSSSTVFYVTGGIFENRELEMLPSRLESLPSNDGRSFMVHLGDWNDPSKNCNEGNFKTFDETYSFASVPTFVVLGENEFNQCEKPWKAFDLFDKYCSRYDEKHWDAPTDYFVERQKEYPNNFAFAYKNVLYISAQVVGGEELDENETVERLESNLDWIDSMVDRYKDQTGTTIIFCNAGPDLVNDSSKASFYEKLAVRIQNDYKRMTVVIHKNNLPFEGWTAKQNFMDISKFAVARVQGGSWPPLRVIVGPNEFSFDQGPWI